MQFSGNCPRMPLCCHFLNNEKSMFIILFSPKCWNRTFWLGCNASWNYIEVLFVDASDFLSKIWPKLYVISIIHKICFCQCTLYVWHTFLTNQFSPIDWLSRQYCDHVIFSTNEKPQKRMLLCMFDIYFCLYVFKLHHIYYIYYILQSHFAILCVRQEIRHSYRVRLQKRKIKTPLVLHQKILQKSSVSVMFQLKNAHSAIALTVFPDCLSPIPALIDAPPLSSSFRIFFSRPVSRRMPHLRHL